ncbi:MAG: CpsD/CapB family tyrosine-protein kinase [Nevskia sp.]|jgi:protein-tyrosine kinase|nr:CpsD/CapB family tyrosine-protein kinase [Nevskia sp.]MCK9383480.1 CpsD/CapB family tyrosine-protein kinase [Nevskia sp.]
MNADPAHDGASEQTELQLREALIRCCALDSEAIKKITHAARVLDIDFSEAAVRTGFVTEEDIEYAQHASQSTSARLNAPKAKPAQELMLSRDPFDPRNEQILALRTELLLRHDGASRANMLAMLSPGRGEGRSQLCAELAMSFAQLGHPTLLVDADLRKPRQHLLFNADNEYGLSHSIAKHETPVLQAVEGFPWLSLLTSGPTPLNPLELLSGSHFERLIKEWRHSYEFVVIDTAPVGLHSDGLAVATLVGRVLTVSRANKTPYKQQKEMLRRLTVTRAQILGAVIKHF